jgi:hypothetical protein
MLEWLTAAEVRRKAVLSLTDLTDENGVRRVSGVPLADPTPSLDGLELRKPRFEDIFKWWQRGMWNSTEWSDRVLCITSEVGCVLHSYLQLPQILVWGNQRWIDEREREREDNEEEW